LSINSHWLRSTLGIDTGGRPLNITFDHHIQHGPLLFPRRGGVSFGVALVSTQFDLSPQRMRPLRSLFPNGVPFSAQTRVDFTGATDTELQIPRGTLPAGFDGDGQQLKLSWDGLAGSLITAPDLGHYELALDSGGIRVSGPFGKLRLLSATVAGRADRDARGRWRGRQQILVQGIALHNTGGDPAGGLRIESAGIVATTGPDGDTSRARSQWRVRRIRLDGTAIRKLGGEVTVAHLNDATLQRLVRRIVGAAPAMASAQSARNRVAPPGVSHPPLSVTVSNLQATMQGGTIDGQFALTYRPDSSPVAGTLFAGLSGQGTLTAPETLVESIVGVYMDREFAARAAVDPSVPTDPAVVDRHVSEQSKRHIANLIEQHMLQRRGRQLTSTLKIDRGRVTADGGPIAKLVPEMATK
ncbi:MAG TPA: DUF945 family protein, partial [Gammaproteobacteria bacterium]|nr:DUF945 family protein [Gammaproteobacteria bacterium]